VIAVLPFHGRWPYSPLEPDTFELSNAVLWHGLPWP
jgi:hypothetical protein